MENFRNMTIILVRLVCLLCFVVSSISINVMSVASFCALIGTKLNIKEVSKRNPLKGKPSLKLDEDLPQELREKVALDVSNFVCYDALHTQSLQNFEKIKLNTACIFAKKARLWGSDDYDSAQDVESNINRFLPTFLKFTLLCEPLGLDGFVLEIPADFGTNVKIFGETVLQILECISQRDPSGNDCMKKSIERKGWVFEFNKVTFFITTFAPCYPSTHPRYAFHSDACFILFQPEISFAQHDLPSDTIHTNWIHPKTVRDQVRVAFKERGQGYLVRDTVSYPMVWDIVRPLDKTDNFVKWWSSV